MIDDKKFVEGIRDGMRIIIEGIVAEEAMLAAQRVEQRVKEKSFQIATGLLQNFSFEVGPHKQLRITVDFANCHEPPKSTR